MHALAPISLSAYRLPFYTITKLAFTLWLVLPQTRVSGAEIDLKRWLQCSLPHPYMLTFPIFFLHRAQHYSTLPTSDHSCAPTKETSMLPSPRLDGGRAKWQAIGS